MTAVITDLWLQMSQNLKYKITQMAALNPSPR